MGSTSRRFGQGLSDCQAQAKQALKTEAVMIPLGWAALYSATYWALLWWELATPPVKTPEHFRFERGWCG
jgi:hypothetical protein